MSRRRVFLLATGLVLLALAGVTLSVGRPTVCRALGYAALARLAPRVRDVR